MSKTVAMNPIPLENEGLTSLLIEGQAHTLQSLLEVAEKDLMGEYTEKWPLAKVLDIGGPACVPRYMKCQSSLLPDCEVPPIPCHVHAGDVVNGACTGHGKTEAYFFPPTDVPPYNLTLGTIKTRLGFKPSTTKENVIEALKLFGQCDDMYSLLNIYEIQQWETWFIEEKIVHAPGPYPTFEIQRPQDDFNLLAWQLGKEVPSNELASVKKSFQLKGLADEDTLFHNTINFPANVDPQFKEKWNNKCESISEGDWGRHLKLFYHLFHGEGFVLHPRKNFIRDADCRPYAGIIWSGEGTINGMQISVDSVERKEFLVTPNSPVEFTNTSDDKDLFVFTVFPMNC
jgi:hypothetical protein